MYEQHFGLTKNPFSMTPDPALLYLTPGYREALAGLAYTILERKGFVVLTGEAGTGKTTLLARTLQCLPSSRVVSSVILNPTLTESEFIELMMMDFGFPNVPASKAQRLVRLQDFLIQVKESGKIAVLVVDEAHKLTPQVLEEIRLLSNLEYPGEKLLQIVLAGQPELVALLKRPDLRQLTQRISVRLSIQFLTAPEVEQYIGLRWSKSGVAPLVFTPETFPVIASSSRGIPRLINAICDNALMAAFAEKSSSVGTRHIAEACRDLWLSGQDSKPQVATGSSGRPAGVSIDELPDIPAPAPVVPIRVLESFDKPRQSRWARWITKLRTAQ
jgi:general secretion pathway protein A